MKLVLVFGLCLVASALGKGIGGRVIGGSDALSGQFPFVLAVDITTNDGRYFCGGTLISNKWAITAAQCLTGATLLSIRMGSTLLTGTDANRVTVATSEYVIHPDFNPDTLENDIALIELRLPVEFSNYLLPIHSLAEDHLTDYQRVVVLGWGQTSEEDAGLTERLQYVPVTTLSNEECRLVYGNQIVDNMVCVEGNYNEGACNGDTGGPLVLVISMGNAQLVGVSSFVSGNGCETTDPSGYTRVWPYRDWITSTTQVEFK